MPKSQNQKLKLLYIMKFLLEETDDEHTLSTSRLIELLAGVGINAERKSIYENIEDLRQFGLDIESRGKGRTSGYYIASRDFELPELKLLVDAVQASKFITRSKSDKLIRKIEGFTSRHLAKELQRQVYVTNRIKHDNESIYYNVDKIHNAINDDVKLSFLYFDWTPEKTKKPRREGMRYVISPQALSWDDENYYMIGYESESGKIKHFRVDKMEKIELEAERREGKELFSEFDMATYSKQVFGMFGGREELVTLSVENRFAGIVIDRFGRDVAIVPGRDGRFTAKARVQVSPPFFSWLFIMGDGAKVIAPADVAEKFAETARLVADIYK